MSLKAKKFYCVKNKGGKIYEKKYQEEHAYYLRYVWV